MCLDITEAASFSEDVSPDITSGTDSTASVSNNMASTGMYSQEN